MTDEIETKLSAACTRLILDRPFLGALVLRMPMKPADPRWCATIGTDARHFYYNPDYIESLSLEQTQFALAHEALHCALSHFARREHRNMQRWDIACDLAINPIQLIVFEQKVMGSVGASLEDLYQAVDLVSRGIIKTVVDRTLPLDQFPEGISLMQSGDLIGKAVLLP